MKTLNEWLEKHEKEAYIFTDSSQMAEIIRLQNEALIHAHDALLSVKTECLCQAKRVSKIRHDIKSALSKTQEIINGEGDGAHS